MLAVGDRIPEFSVQDENGNIITQKNMMGHKTILFFYPKDNTPGCTAEACNLRDNYKELTDMGFIIYGVSPDTMKKHQNFIEKHGFQFPLLADTDKALLQGFGVWGEKKFMGRTYDGVHRTTFIINDKGIIEHVIKKVKTKDHTAQILEIINTAG